MNIYSNGTEEGRLAPKVADRQRQVVLGASLRDCTPPLPHLQRAITPVSHKHSVEILIAETHGNRITHIGILT